ncbi:MAG: hypothetical protein Q3980_16670 [Turicibacter sp.]|nr:hypothetical protein [Turicibacter sp.]
MSLETIEKIKGEKTVITKPIQKLILFIPPLITPLLPYSLGVRDEELVVAIIAMIIFGFVCGVYLIRPDKCVLKITKEHVWINHVGRFSCRVDLLKQEQIHSIALNHIDKNWVVSMAFEEDNEIKIFEFTIKDKIQFEDLKKKLSAQLPDISNKMVVKS